MTTETKIVLGVLGVFIVGGGGFWLITQAEKKDKSGNPAPPVSGDTPTGASSEGSRAEFDEYSKYILEKWESVYINNRTEVSKYAIVKQWYPSEDIPNMTLQRAQDIIFRDYWLKYNLFKLPQHLRFIVLDCAINQGQPTSIRLLQKAANVKVDGINGTVTQSAAKSVTVQQYFDLREEQYRESAKGDRAQYFQGWINRLNDILEKTADFE